MRNKLLRMNLQLFAEPGGEGGDGGTGGGEPGGAGGNTPSFDYEKLAGLIAGKQTVTEETVLKNYFKQQGLNAEEMKQAINAFKEQKQKNTPDVTALQQQLSQSQAAADKAMLDNAATMQAITMGIDAKTIPYILKLADFSAVKGEDGKIGEEALKNAITKVLEDIPGLKPQAQQNAGFQMGGAGGNGGAGGTGGVDELASIFGNAK